VFRGWGGAAALDLLTDGRSAKGHELALQPAVEICWLLPRARCQFRLRGAVQDLSPEQLRQELDRHWQALSSGARALWGWPEPGAPLVSPECFPQCFPQHWPAELGRPEHVQLLRCALSDVELLELSGNPHQRRRWREETGWQEIRLNP
jgi:pyridoxamine 5'-phosphate oxidase